MKKLFHVLALISLSLTMISCSNKESKNKVDNSIHINFQQEPVTYDPRKVVDYTSTTVSYLLFEGLTRMTPTSTAALGIAKSIDISKDGKTYTFHLRDAKWSNGTPLTAYDFCQTWLDMLNPTFPAPNAHLLFPIVNAQEAKRGEVALRDVGIQVIDYKTLEVKLHSPTPYFEELISYCIFSPICQTLASENPNWDSQEDRTFVCNGPYRIAKRKLGSEIILEKNPHYWDADNVALEQIEISIIDDETTALNMFKNNQLDMIGLPFTGIHPDSIPDLLEKELIETTNVPATTICCFNLDKPPFNNVNIRKAFALALNRKEIVENITQTGETPGLKILPDHFLPNQSEPNFKDGDVESALSYFNKGLKELDMKVEDLPQITMLHASTGIYPKVAQAIQEQWRKALGVNIILTGFEYKVFLDKLAKKDFCISQCIWVAQYFDPMNILDRFCVKENVKNYPGYDNKAYRDLVMDSVYYQNKQKRFNQLVKALDVLNNDVPLTAVYHWKNPYMKKGYVKNLKIRPKGTFHLSSISIDKDKTPKNRPVDVAVR